MDICTLLGKQLDRLVSRSFDRKVLRTKPEMGMSSMYHNDGCGRVN